MQKEHHIPGLGCPNCGQIVAIDEQTYNNEPTNCDNVCDDCIMELGYYE